MVECHLLSSDIKENKLTHQGSFFLWHEFSLLLLLSFFKFKFIYFTWRLITLQYCIGFAIHQHESFNWICGRLVRTIYSITRFSDPDTKHLYTHTPHMHRTLFANFQLSGSNVSCFHHEYCWLLMEAGLGILHFFSYLGFLF